MERLFFEEMFQYRESCFRQKDGGTDWKTFAVLSDENGFDIRHEIIYDYVLESGITICRYGAASGRFTCPKGTSYEEISLPYITESMPYHEYIVLDDISVRCIVSKGLAAPNFFCKGGGVQYYHPVSILEEVERGAIKEVFEWMLR